MGIICSSVEIRVNRSDKVPLAPTALDLKFNESLIPTEKFDRKSNIFDKLRMIATRSSSNIENHRKYVTKNTMNFKQIKWTTKVHTNNKLLVEVQLAAKMLKN